ncbi:putative sulfate exporter family transporter [Weissella muntiaci]|uniref:Putative sulfate exporter family transporter n=1 Tax=Weissella muntiaci TaxID=2508881 RepID=A0A6C2C2I8_9LACO|nr:putative sulfate exporter family transporter [Weissella muntiaci]TYC48178.1 putative sulfate exporter family transporter [Weissella muntiaci]
MKITKKMLVGILLTLGLAVFSDFLSHYIPNIGAEALALILGMLLGNTILTNKRWEPGVKWAEKYPIEIGIALLGVEVTLTTIESLGWQGIVFILIQMTATIFFVLFIGGRLFKVSAQSAMLMGAGNAVCGSSAIAAVAPEIDATDDQRRTAVATVSLSGVLLLFILPILGPSIYHGNNLLIGALIGGTVQSVGQVIGTASLVNPAVIDYATLFKMLRVILLSVVVLAMSNSARKMRQNEPGNHEAQAAKHIQIHKLVPWFIYAFLGLLAFSTIVALPHSVVLGAKSVTGFFGVVNLAGIGLNLKWQTIKASGVKFMGYGLVTITFQVLAAILLISLIY